jgi:hypothetical protein
VKYVKLGHTGTDVSAIDLCVAPVIVSAAQEVDMVEQSGGDPEVDGGSEPWTPTGEELAHGSVSAAASPRTPWQHRVERGCGPPPWRRVLASHRLPLVTTRCVVKSL